MRKASANLSRLINAAELLRPLLEELVFVGGSITGLLITDEAAADPRVTFRDACMHRRAAGTTNCPPNPRP
jgi:hypothetical protein